jgi:uncharacterized RDD family membrane protein YckC
MGGSMTENQEDTTKVRAGRMTYASYVRRVTAWFIDVFIIFAVFFGVAVSLRFAFLPPGERGASGQGPEILLIPFMPLYGALCHRYWHGQTLGKRVLGIAVTDVHGGPISLGQALGRAYLRAALFVFAYLPWILDSLWPLWQSNNRSLHDLAASTVVVQNPRGGDLSD